MRRSKTKPRTRFLLRYFGIIAMVLAAAAFLAPMIATLTPGDARTLFSLGGICGGVALVLLIGSLVVRDRDI